MIVNKTKQKSTSNNMYKLKFHEPQANLPIYWYQVMKFHPKINKHIQCNHARVNGAM